MTCVMKQEALEELKQQLEIEHKGAVEQLEEAHRKALSALQGEKGSREEAHLRALQELREKAEAEREAIVAKAVGWLCMYACVCM